MASAKLLAHFGSLTLASLALAIVAPTLEADQTCSSIVRAYKQLVVPAEMREDFIKYIQENGRTDKLSYAAVESEQHLDMFLQNVESGIIAIVIENKKGESLFGLRIETCDATKDWRPFWIEFLKFVDQFPRESA